LSNLNGAAESVALGAIKSTLEELGLSYTIEEV